MACPDASTCFAVGQGGEIVVTSNGGTTWTGQTAPITDDLLFGITCMTALACTTVGSDGGSLPAFGQSVAFTTTDGGTTWVNGAVPSGPFLDAVACLSADQCVAGGGSFSGRLVGAALTTSDGGASWVSATVPSPGIDRLTSVSCPSSEDCFAVGNGTIATEGGAIVATTDGGSTWTTQPMPADVYGLVAVSCPTTLRCTAFGLNLSQSLVVIGTSNGGATWTDQSTQVGTVPWGLSCPSVLDCYAVGEGASYDDAAVYSTTDGGLHWTEKDLASGVSPVSLSITCPTAIKCIVIEAESTSPGAAEFVTTDGWSSFQSLAPVGVASSDYEQSSIDCPSTTRCYLADGGGYVSVDGGMTWATETLPSGTSISGISCASVDDCRAVGDFQEPDAVIATADGGVHWAVQTVVPSGAVLEWISCGTTERCIATGETVGSGGIQGSVDL